MVAAESILERVLQEVQDSPHSQFPREFIYFEGPWFGIGKKAVQILKDVSEIRDFMTQYTVHIQDKYGLKGEDAETVAKNCVGYCTGYVDNEQANIWFKALSDISHPMMGRERPFKGGDNVGLYYVIGKSKDKKFRKYLARTLSERLSKIGFRILDETNSLSGMDNPSYFAIRIEPINTKWLGNQGTYMFLTGVVSSMEYRMEDELGKSCKLSLETLPKK